jgi:hypothetical protein
MAVFTTLAAIGAAVGLTGAAATIGGAVIAGSAVYGASKLIGGKQESGGGGSSATTPAPLPTPPSVGTSEIEAKAAIDQKRRAVARNKTNYTSPIGLTDSAKSDLALKTLTGQ